MSGTAAWLADYEYQGQSGCCVQPRRVSIQSHNNVVYIFPSGLPPNASFPINAARRIQFVSESENPLKLLEQIVSQHGKARSSGIQGASLNY